MAAMYSTQWAKSTFTVAVEKRRQLTVHCLHTIMQITACPTFANDRQIAACISPQLIVLQQDLHICKIQTYRPVYASLVGVVTCVGEEQYD